MFQRRAASRRGAARESARVELVEVLFRRHYAGLVRLAVVMLSDREAAEDAVQDAFVALQRNLPLMRDPEAAEAYLRSAVLNRCRSWVRRQVTQRTPRPLMLVREHRDSPEDTAVDRDEVGSLVAAMRTLARRQREVLACNLDAGPAGCGGQEFALRASLPEPGSMRWVRTRPETSDCSLLRNTRGVLEQMLPTNNAYLAGLALSAEPGWKPVADPSALHGLWMAEGGGQVLEIDPTGSYFVAHESGEPTDRGRWSLSGSSPTLVSSAASTACTEGARLVWGELELVNPGTTAMRGTVTENACGAVWADRTWILIPHGGS